MRTAEVWIGHAPGFGKQTPVTHTSARARKSQVVTIGRLEERRGKGGGSGNPKAKRARQAVVKEDESGRACQQSRFCRRRLQDPRTTGKGRRSHGVACELGRRRKAGDQPRRRHREIAQRRVGETPSDLTDQDPRKKDGRKSALVGRRPADGAAELSFVELRLQ